MRSITKLGLGAGLAAALMVSTAMAQEGEPIKVGILHSLSGTMAISETTLKDVMLMLIEQQNAKGGLLGRPLEAVVVDPASDWPLFAEKARELIAANGVDVVFGCWTSVSRKSVLPVFEELNSILFYPVQYEGEESQRNVFYTGAAPNQQAIPAVDYLMDQGVERWVLAGTDYVYPRTTNKILEAYLQAKGECLRATGAAVNLLNKGLTPTKAVDFDHVKTTGKYLILFSDGFNIPQSAEGSTVVTFARPVSTVSSAQSIVVKDNTVNIPDFKSHPLSAPTEMDVTLNDGSKCRFLLQPGWVGPFTGSEYTFDCYPTHVASSPAVTRTPPPLPPPSPPILFPPDEPKGY